MHNKYFWFFQITVYPAISNPKKCIFLNTFNMFSKFTKQFTNEPPLVCEYNLTKPVVKDFLKNGLATKNRKMFFKKKFFYAALKQSNILFNNSIKTLKSYHNVTWVSSQDPVMSTYINFLVKKNNQFMINNYLLRSKR